MSRLVLTFVLGLGLGGMLVGFLRGDIREPIERELASLKKEHGELAVQLEEAKRLAADRTAELDEYRVRVESSRSEDVVRGGSEKVDVAEPASVPLRKVFGGDSKDAVIDTQVAVIEKFVPLSESQKELLRDKYTLEFEAEDGLPLEEIIGEENAEFVERELAAARARSELRRQKQEALYIVRELGLSAEREGEVFEVISRIEDQIEEWRAEQRVSRELVGLKARMALAIEERNLRRDYRRSAFRGVLNSEEFESYLKWEEESAEADFTLWHDAPVDQSGG